MILPSAFFSIVEKHFLGKQVRKMLLPCIQGESLQSTFTLTEHMDKYGSQSSILILFSSSPSRLHLPFLLLLLNIDDHVEWSNDKPIRKWRCKCVRKRKRNIHPNEYKATCLLYSTRFFASRFFRINHKRKCLPIIVTVIHD